MLFRQTHITGQTIRESSVMKLGPVPPPRRQCTQTTIARQRYSQGCDLRPYGKPCRVSGEQCCPGPSFLTLLKNIQCCPNCILSHWSLIWGSFTLTRVIESKTYSRCVANLEWTKSLLCRPVWTCACYRGSTSCSATSTNDVTSKQGQRKKDVRQLAFQRPRNARAIANGDHQKQQSYYGDTGGDRQPDVDGNDGNQTASIASQMVR